MSYDHVIPKCSYLLLKQLGIAFSIIQVMHLNIILALLCQSVCNMGVSLHCNDYIWHHVIGGCVLPLTCPSCPLLSSYKHTCCFYVSLHSSIIDH